MAGRTLLVVGAGGDVGRGIVEAALASGRRVVASGRSEAPLAALAGLGGSDRLVCVQGDVGDGASALGLWEAATGAFGAVHEVVVSIHAPSPVKPLVDLACAELATVLAGNVFPHLIAAQIFLPRLTEDGLIIGIGGGTADFILPQMTPISMAQAALRMLYRGLARERRSGAQLRELMIVSMVAGQSNRDEAPADWLTDLEVGRHVCAILDAPGRFAKPILHLRSREQVGQPEADA